MTFRRKRILVKYYIRNTLSLKEHFEAVFLQYFNPILFLKLARKYVFILKEFKRRK